MGAKIQDDRAHVLPVQNSASFPTPTLHGVNVSVRAKSYIIITD